VGCVRKLPSITGVLITQISRGFGKLRDMAANFEDVFAALRLMFGKHATRLAVKADTPTEYTLVGKFPSPFPQHKGHPVYFGSVRLGKAYVSFHLFPLYMNPALTKTISPALKKHMQGKTCFNFKTSPAPEILSELKQLTKAGFEQFHKKKWL
jgi:hypothetical protein